MSSKVSGVVCSAWFVIMALSGCQSPSTEREIPEGYFSWIDEQGMLRISAVPRETIQDVVEESRRSKKRADASPEPAAATASESEPKEPETPAVEPVTPKPSSASETAESASTPTSPAASAQPTASPSTLAGKRQSTTAERASALQKDVPLDLAHYPDANKLARDGYQRAEDPSPYFTWTDAEGNLRTTYYRRSDMSGSDSGGASMPPEERLSPAQELRAAAKPSEQPLPEAFAVLGLDQSEANDLEALAAACCRSLVISDPVEWKEGREFEVRFGKSTAVREFLEGTSPYRLIKLPPAADSPELTFEVRSFNQGGVFVPSLIFLDENLEPQRALQDVVYEYHRETWHRLGFIEARLAAYPAAGERWLLVYSRKKDQQERTIVEIDGQSGAIRHRTEGAISLKTVN